MAARNPKRWVARVKTDSTHPPKGLFTKDASTIARLLASRRVSPKGPGSGIRMLIYFINRGGKGLSRSRRPELQRAKIVALGTNTWRESFEEHAPGCFTTQKKKPLIFSSVGTLSVQRSLMEASWQERAALRPRPLPLTFALQA